MNVNMFDILKVNFEVEFKAMNGKNRPLVTHV